jgi:acyl-coenzyme A synthetase/AMP-(fatty) acid ligase
MPSGYFDDPVKFADAIVDGWILTGDLGYFDDDEYLFVLDRIKYLLKSLTLHFTPLELETIINEIEGVIESSVVGVFDEGNDVVYAFVTKSKDNQMLKTEDVKNYINLKVNKEKNVREVVFIDNFPRTPSGKVRKDFLKEMARKIHESKKI